MSGAFFQLAADRSRSRGLRHMEKSRSMASELSALLFNPNRLRGRSAQKRRTQRRRQMPRFYSHHDQLSIYAEPSFESAETEFSGSSSLYSLSTMAQASSAQVVFGFLEQRSHRARLDSFIQQTQPGYVDNQNDIDDDDDQPTLQGLAVELAAHYSSDQVVILQSVLKQTYPIPMIVYDRTSTATAVPAPELSLGNTNLYLNQGTYRELYSIARNVSPAEEQSSPADPYSAGCVVIVYKVLCLDDQTNLARTWLNWTGARELYALSPAAWQLRHITLHTCLYANEDGSGGGDSGAPTAASRRAQHKLLSRSFAYVLLAEYDRILMPGHFVQAARMVERLAHRACGNVGLYRVVNKCQPAD